MEDFSDEQSETSSSEPAPSARGTPTEHIVSPDSTNVEMTETPSSSDTFGTSSDTDSEEHTPNNQVPPPEDVEINRRSPTPPAHCNAPEVPVAPVIDNTPPVPPTPPSEMTKVFVRLKPLSLGMNTTKKQQRYYVTSPSLFINLNDVEQDMNSNVDLVQKKFVYSGAFGDEDTQTQVFDQVVMPRMVDYLHGINCAVMTYGTAQSGKFYTLVGSPEDPGLIPRTLEHIFAREKPVEIPNYKPGDNTASCLTVIQRFEELDTRRGFLSAQSRKRMDMYADRIQTPEKGCEVWVSFAEIRNEMYFDVLSSDYLGSHPSLIAKTDSQDKTYIKGLTHVSVGTPSEACDVLAFGYNNLLQWNSNMTTSASESHCIFTVTLLRYESWEGTESAEASSFSFCDLAAHTFPKIDVSLLAVLRSLEYIKCRNPVTLNDCFCPSSLTKLFAGAFKKESPLSLIVTVDPSPMVYREVHTILQWTSVQNEIHTKIRNPYPSSEATTAFGRISETHQGTDNWEELTAEKLMELSENFKSEIDQLKALIIAGDAQRHQRSINRYSLMIKRIENSYKRKAEAEAHSEEVDGLKTISQKLRSQKQLLERELVLCQGKLEKFPPEYWQTSGSRSPHYNVLDEILATRDARAKNKVLMKTLNEAKMNYLRVTANTREKQRKIGEIEKKTLAFRLDRDSELAQQKIINNVLKERLDMAINEEEKLMYHEKYYERYQNEMGAKLGHVEDGKEEKLMGAEVDPPSGVNTFDEGKGLSGVSPEVDLPGGNVNPQTESEEMKAIPTDVQVPLTSPTVPRAGSWDESAENRRSGGETGEIDGTIQQRIIERPFKELNLVSEKERLERQEEVQQMFGNLEDVEPEGVEQSMESGIDVHSQVHGPDGEEMISRASSVAGVPEGKIESQTELRRMEIPTEDQASLNSQTQFSASSFDEGVMSSYSESEVVDSFRGNQISCFKDSAVPPSVLEAEGGFAKGVGMATPEVPPSDLHRPTDDDQINMACEKTVLSLKSPLSFEDWSDDGSEEQNIVQTLSLCSSGTYEIPSVQQTSLIACSDTKMQAPESQISQSFERGASHEGRNLETQLVSEINDRRAPIPRMSFADDNYSTILPGSQPMPVGSVGYPEPGKSPRDDILITTQQILESSSDGTSTAVEMASTSINVVLQEKEDIEGEKSQEPPSLESRDQYSDNDLVFEAAGPSEPRVKVSESTINDLNEYESIHVHSPGSEASTEVPELRIIDSDDLEASQAQSPDSPSASQPLGSLEPEMEMSASQIIHSDEPEAIKVQSIGDPLPSEVLGSTEPQIKVMESKTVDSDEAEAIHTHPPHSPLGSSTPALAVQVRKSEIDETETIIPGTVEVQHHTVTAPVPQSTILPVDMNEVPSVQAGDSPGVSDDLYKCSNVEESVDDVQGLPAKCDTLIPSMIDNSVIAEAVKPPESSDGTSTNDEAMENVLPQTSTDQGDPLRRSTRKRSGTPQMPSSVKHPKPNPGTPSSRNSRRSSTPSTGDTVDPETAVACSTCGVAIVGKHRQRLKNCRKCSLDDLPRRSTRNTPGTPTLLGDNDVHSGAPLVTCDNCFERITDECRYHCKICNDGNFDLCKVCYSEVSHKHEVEIVPTIPQQ